jgi:Enoyl-CoA hydratase/isomerase
VRSRTDARWCNIKKHRRYAVHVHLVYKLRDPNGRPTAMDPLSTENLLLVQLMKELVQQMKDCDADESISSIIITGSKGIFSRGLDLGELSSIKTYGQARINPCRPSVCRSLRCYHTPHTIQHLVPKT